jgi:hypothetical protein
MRSTRRCWPVCSCSPSAFRVKVTCVSSLFSVEGKSSVERRTRNTLLGRYHNPTWSIWARASGRCSSFLPLTHVVLAPESAAACFVVGSIRRSSLQPPPRLPSSQVLRRFPLVARGSSLVSAVINCFLFLISLVDRYHHQQPDNDHVHSAASLVNHERTR